MTIEAYPKAYRIYQMCFNTVSRPLKGQLSFEIIQRASGPFKKKRMPVIECSALSETGPQAWASIFWPWIDDWAFCDQIGLEFHQLGMRLTKRGLRANLKMYKRYCLLTVRLVDFKSGDQKW